MTFYHLTPKSSNRKTGPIPVSTTSKHTCPTACPLRGNGCYAEVGPMNMFWDKLTTGQYALDLDGFVAKLRAVLKPGQLWRHNQADDLPGKSNRINRAELRSIAKASRDAGARGFTFTHKPPTPYNIAACKEASRLGLTVNLSANNLEEADDLSRHGLPVTTVLTSDQIRATRTPGGRRVAICPAAVRKDISCANCEACWHADRGVIIGFPAHGARVKKVNLIARG